MKTPMTKLVCFAALSLFVLLGGEAQAKTFAAHFCTTQDPDYLIIYTNSSAWNNGEDSFFIHCPMTREKDDGDSPVSGGAYFVDDGKTKHCYLDVTHHGIGSIWMWSDAYGVSHLEFAPVGPIRASAPIVMNCKIEGGAKLTGYYLHEE